MEIFNIKTADLKPYKDNPRRNDSAVEYVANSIKEFGFKVPLVIDRDNIIICGHTRLKAAQALGLEAVPCIMADDLTPEQVKAFRLADNKTAELADWDADALAAELDDIFDLDMADFGFTDSLDDISAQAITTGGELDADNFADDKFECTCPKCGFKFNRK